MQYSIKHKFVIAGWFRYQSFLNSIYSLCLVCCSFNDVCHILMTFDSNSIFNVPFLFSNVNVAQCSSIVVSSASHFSADFATTINWPFPSPFLYSTFLGSFSMADTFQENGFFRLLSSRNSDHSLSCSSEFTFSVENRVQFKNLIFHLSWIDADLLSSFYLSHSSRFLLVIVCCLLAAFGCHHCGSDRKIKCFTVFLSWGYPGDSRFRNFSGFASIFCTAARRHPLP